MSTHCGFIVEVNKLRPHGNADRLQIADFFGNETCVSLDVAIGDKGIYFPTDLQLSVAFCEANNLVRKKDDAGNSTGGFLDPDKRNVKTIRLRGEPSDGMYLPIEALGFTGIDVDSLEIGTQITAVNGIEICQKYIPRSNKQPKVLAQGNRTRKKKEKTYPYFTEHIDTPQLRFNLFKFKPGDIICLTEKVHGTSSRNGYCLTIDKNKNLLHKIFCRKKEKYQYVAGSRRTIISQNSLGFYGTNKFREDWNNRFKNKLNAGEQVFGEIAGFYDIDCPIMGKCDNKKTNDKDFILKYGDQTIFSYGCDSHGKDKPLNRYFIYRMTYTSPDGYVIEYSWDQVKARAAQMGIETVPELERFIYTTEEDFLNRIKKYLDIPSTIDPSHVIEGVVVRVLNNVDFLVAKEKSYNFKVIEGIIKSEATDPDMEEAEDLKLP